MAMVTAYVIQVAVDSGADRFWDGQFPDFFTTDTALMIRFEREVDAERMLTQIQATHVGRCTVEPFEYDDAP